MEEFLLNWLPIIFSSGSLIVAYKALKTSKKSMDLNKETLRIKKGEEFINFTVRLIGEPKEGNISIAYVNEKLIQEKKQGVTAAVVSIQDVSVKITNGKAHSVELLHLDTKRKNKIENFQKGETEIYRIKWPTVTDRFALKKIAKPIMIGESYYDYFILIVTGMNGLRSYSLVYRQYGLDFIGEKIVRTVPGEVLFLKESQVRTANLADEDSMYQDMIEWFCENTDILRGIT